MLAGTITFIVTLIYTLVGTALLDKKYSGFRTDNFISDCVKLVFWPYYLLKKQGNCK